MKELQQKKITINDLIFQANEIENQLLAADGEIDENLEKALAIHNGHLSRKTDALYFVLTSLEKEIEYFNEREKEIYALRERHEAALDALKGRILQLLDICEGGTLTGDLYTLKMRKSGGKVVVHNEDEIPAKYKIIKQSEVVDKKLMLQDLKLGVKIEGADIAYEPTLSKGVRK